jgi:transcriptional regulator of acetoin/glycerol metabolism
VRELENTIESLLLQAGARGVSPADLAGLDLLSGGLVIDERTRLLRVLEEHRWQRRRAAAALGISRVTLWRRMVRHALRDFLCAPADEAG